MISKKEDAERTKEWRRKNPEKVKDYADMRYKRDIDKIRKYGREYQKKNKEKIKSYSKMRYERDKEKVIFRIRRWERENHEKYRAYQKSSKVKAENIIRRKTREKYPIKGKFCEVCSNKAELRHHITFPMEVDKFIFVCKKCHGEIHYGCVNDNTNENYSQQPSENAKIQGEGGCTESLDSERNINSGFEETGKSSKNPSADTNDLCECGHSKWEHTEKDKPTRCMYGNGFSCKCKKFVKQNKGGRN